MEENRLEKDATKKELLHEELEPRMATGAQQSSRPVSKLYGVPRRFDLMTMMIVTLAYSLLFGLLQWFEYPPVFFAVVAGFVTTVGLAQALLFKGKRPRTSSMLAGSAFVIVISLVPFILDFPNLSVEFLIVMGCWGVGIYGILFGYVAGVLVAGLFLVADVARTHFKR